MQCPQFVAWHIELFMLQFVAMIQTRCIGGLFLQCSVKSSLPHQEMSINELSTISGLISQVIKT